MHRLYTLPGIVIVICLLGFSPYTVAQNRVFNPGFENKTDCPRDWAHLFRCINWRAYHAGSTDYFACNDKTAGVPGNIMGYQHPAQGTAYAGIINYASIADYKEYLAGIIQPLTKGKFYEVSISVSLAGHSMFTANDLGVWFYDKGPTASIPFAVAALQVTPHVSYAKYGLITDSSGWTRLSGIFRADSAYDNLVIGGFTHVSQMTAIPFNTMSVQPYSYYYIDSVVVQQANIGYELSDTAYCVGDTLKLLFEPRPDLYNPGNVFSLQLSDATGSFAGANVIATIPGNTGGTFTWPIPLNTPPGTGYRLRIITSNIADSSIISLPFAIGNTLPDKPVPTSNTPVCQGEVLKLHATSTTAGVSYKWEGPGSFTAYGQDVARPNMLPAQSGVYTVTSSLYGCTSSDVAIVDVIATNGILNSSSNSPVCEGDALMLSASTASGRGLPVTYSWHGPNGFVSADKDPVISPATSDVAGDYRVTISVSGCRSKDTVTVPVIIKPVPAKPDAYVNSPICLGDTIKLGTNTTGVGYSWTGPHSFVSSLQYPSIPYAQYLHEGDYILTITHDGCSNRDTINVQVSTVPIPLGGSNSPLKVGDTLLLRILYPDNDVNYNWTGPKGFTSSSVNPFVNNVNYENAGTYIITASQNGCTSSSLVLVTVDPREDSTFFLVYPNANNGNFTIFATALREQLVPINITAINGQLVYKTNVLTENRLLKININLKDRLASGVYNLRVMLDAELHVVRLVVNRGMQ